MTAWTDLPFARRHWPDAQAMDDARLTDVLTAAQEALVDFAPALPDGSPVPLRYAFAVVYHARDLVSASMRDGDVIGVGDLAVRVRPLSSTVRSLLRPPSRGSVG